MNTLGTGQNEPARVIPGLTGLRGVAAVWVVLFHLTQPSDIPIISGGYMGVDVFFMLSGFVLAYVYSGKLDTSDLRGYLYFLRARVARIYPLHLVMLCVVVGAVLLLPGFADRYPQVDERFGIGSLIASVLLIQNWFHWLPSSWNSPSWSLSAEWFAYLTFPVFMLLTQRWRSIVVPLVLAAASLLVLVAGFSLKGLHHLGPAGAPGMLRAVFEFACGCLLSRAVANGLKRLPLTVDAAAVGLLLVALLDTKVIFLVLPSFALMVLLAAQNRGWIARGLSTAPAVFLGEISYSIYMVHWIVLQIANWLSEGVDLGSMQSYAWDILVLSTIFLISILSYRFIERPARNWGRRLTPQSSRTLAPTVSR